MIYKNIGSQKLAVYAYTVADGAAKTGDAGNITCYLSKDWGGAAAVTDTNPTELDSTNMKGWYVFDLAQAETNAEVLVFAPVSATAGVVVDQVQVFTQDAAISSRAPSSTALTNATWTDARAGYIDKAQYLPAATAGQAGGVFIAGSNAATSVTTALTANITGNLSGSVGSVTGAVGSVTGAVGSVAGAVGSVGAGGITAASFAADAISAAAVSAAAVTKVQSGLATPTNITAGTITTVTNLTNAPTNGDLTATMKTSVTTAATAATPTAAAVTGAVGSVTGLTASNLDATISSRAATGEAAAAVATLNDLSAAQVNAEVVDALVTDVVADSIPALGSRGSIAQYIYMIGQFLMDRGVVTTTATIRKADGSTALFTCTLNDAVTPTDVTRAT